MSNLTTPIAKHRAPGFTLVEIMVAISLSLVLIAGVGQIYLSSKESYRVQNELARLQENQRIAIEFLQNNIRQAGFKPYGEPPLGRLLVTDSANGNNDSIKVSFTSDTDCLGAQTPNGIAENTFFIRQNNQNQTTQLMCLGNGNPNNPQPIADNIESMQILLGEDTNFANNTPTALTPDRYVNVNALNNMINVVSVRIALLTRTNDPIRKQPINENLTVLDTVFNTTAADPDRTRRLKRQVITTTIPLRNPFAKSLNNNG